jgi:hypothetical protein
MTYRTPLRVKAAARCPRRPNSRQAYNQFDKPTDGWTKVILHPGKNS